MRVPVDKDVVLANGTVQMKDSARILDNIDWTVSGNYVQKNDLMIIDLLAHNNWERPIYFAATAGANSYLNLAPYLQLEGLAYRLVPIKKNDTIEQQETRIATDIMYDNVMNNFAWGGMEVPGTFLDYVFLRSCAVNTRQRLGQLATELIVQGDTEKAIKVLDKVIEVTPEENVPYDATMYSIVMAYYQAGAYEKANVLADKLFTTCEINLNYYYALDPTKRSSFGPEIRQSQSILERMEYFIGAQFNQTEISDQFKERYAALLAKNNMQRLR
jgi:tetratricopeptide (TPR) repeat protein